MRFRTIQSKTWHLLSSMSLMYIITWIILVMVSSAYSQTSCYVCDDDYECGDPYFSPSDHMTSCDWPYTDNDGCSKTKVKSDVFGFDVTTGEGGELSPNLYIEIRQWKSFACLPFSGWHSCDYSIIRCLVIKPLTLGMVCWKENTIV